MGPYIIRRLLAFIPTLLAITIMVGLLMDFMPGDPVAQIMGAEASKEIITRRRQELGLDRPVYVRLSEYVWKAAHGDLGNSILLSESVSKLVATRFPITLCLTLFAMIVSVAAGIPVGIVAAVRQGTPWDWVGMTLSLIVLSIPSFWLALNMVFFFSVKLRMFPVAGWVSPGQSVPEFFRRLVLPGMALGLGSAAMIARFTRTSMLEVLRQEYVTVARAKGLREQVVLYRHAFRNALVPVVTIIGIQFGGLLGGAFIIETVFNIPGLGALDVNAITRRDYPLVQGTTLVITAIYLVVNLATDVIYGLIDPRIRY
jgi:peptide/nickel transport system permease protein